MANDQNKINELVSDDDEPTVELEVLNLRKQANCANDVARETDADTYRLGESEELETDSRAQRISRLQFDIEQLRSKWQGLQTEIEAREQIVDGLNQKLRELRDKMARKDKLLRKRNVAIRALKAEIRQRDESHREVLENQAATAKRIGEVEAAAEDGAAALRAVESEASDLRRQLEQLRSHSATREGSKGNYSIREIEQQLHRRERYADELRIKLQDLSESHAYVGEDRDRLAQKLNEKTRQHDELSALLEQAQETIGLHDQRIDDLQRAHEEELRLLRFELGEAQNTIAESSDLNTQLASDLVDTRNFKEELERMLADNEERAQDRISELEKDLGKFQRSAAEYEEKLESKTAAFNVLLNQLSKKSEQIDEIGDVVELSHDDQPAPQVDSDASSNVAQADSHDRERDKVTRLLIGSIGNQDLRFPLFKDRLTIGRTADNDIQLKLSFVSRRHAVVLTEGDTTRVIDWGSKNGVYVNSKRIKEHFLSNGDILAVGNAKFRYEERRKRE